MAESNKQQMLQKLQDLKLIIEMPKLYLANYFQNLRNKVDKYMFSKQILHNNDIEKKNELNQIWTEMISKIDSFEKECKNKDELQSNLNRINKIKMMLDDQNEAKNLEKIEDKIQEEEFELHKKIFQNKTIIFDEIFEDVNQKRLLIVKDEYFIWIPIDNR